MPKNGDELSILSYGCMRLPMQGGKIDEARAIRQLHYGIDQGINYLDTAWPYHAGESEVLVGKAIQGGYRDKVRVATKLPSWMINSRQDMDRYLNAQLKKLGTDHIDYYLVHALNGVLWETMERFQIHDFLDQAKKDGRIINAGFSFHGAGPEFPRIVDAYPWVFTQIQYNYLDQENQAGTRGLEYAAAKGMGVVVMEPLRGGNLAKTPPPAIASIWSEAQAQRSPAEWALRWIWNRPEVTTVLSGLNEEVHIQENIAIAGKALPYSLTLEELALVDRVARIYQETMKVGCTGCGYCLPCPANVNIPICFEEYNKMHLFGNVEEGKFVYAFRMSGDLVDGKPAYASQCVQCGDCLERCPQEIPIPDVLKNVAADMEDAELNNRAAMARQIFKIEA